MDVKLKELQEKVTCTVCKSTLQEPKLLQCFHTFCKECIAQLAGSLGEEETLKCPECRAEIMIPDGNNFDALKPSVFHTRILDALGLCPASKTYAVCSVSEDHSTSLSYCSDCSQNFCQECLTHHHAILFKDHSIAEVKDIDVEAILLTHKEPLCKQHTNNKVKFYCNDCDAGICQRCQNSEHKEHDIVDLRKDFGENIAFLYTCDQGLQEKESAIQAIVDCLEATAIKTIQNAELVKRQVCEEAERPIAVINQSKQELLDEVEAKVETVTEKRDNGVSLLRQVQCARRCFRQLREQGTALEIASTKKLIQERSSSLIDKELIPAQPDTNFMFIANKDSLNNLASGIGVIKTTHATDPTTSSVAVSSSKVEALSKIELTVVTCNSDGVTSNNPDDIIKVKITPEEDVKFLQEIERRDEKTCAYFIAGFPGTYTAKVTVNGEPVNNSPLHIKVGEQRISISSDFNMNGIQGPLTSPGGITVNSDYSAIAITDATLNCVAVFNRDGLLLKKLGSAGKYRGQLNNPCSVAFINQKEIAVVDNGNNRIQIFKIKTGACTDPKAKRNEGQDQVAILFNGPIDVHVDKQGRIIVTESGNQLVRVFSADWILQFQFGLGTNEQWKPCCTVAHDSKFFVSDELQRKVHVFDKVDNVYTRIHFIPVYSPRGLVIDNDGYLLVFTGDCINKLTLDGRKVGTCTLNANGQPSRPALLPNGCVMFCHRVWSGYGDSYAARVSLVN